MDPTAIFTDKLTGIQLALHVHASLDAYLDDITFVSFLLPRGLITAIHVSQSVPNETPDTLLVKAPHQAVLERTCPWQDLSTPCWSFIDHSAPVPAFFAYLFNQHEVGDFANDLCWHPFPRRFSALAIPGA